MGGEWGPTGRAILFRGNFYKILSFETPIHIPSD